MEKVGIDLSISKDIKKCCQNVKIHLERIYTKDNL
jgi:hypothetical protein